MIFHRRRTSKRKKQNYADGQKNEHELMPQKENRKKNAREKKSVLIS